MLLFFNMFNRFFIVVLVFGFVWLVMCNFLLILFRKLFKFDILSLFNKNIIEVILDNSFV